MSTATRQTIVRACENCGRRDRLAVLAVIEKATGRAKSIRLCESCEGSRFRSCWLRYERADRA
jgi:hypothetical protein